MLYHMGVLDGPNSRTLQWIKSGRLSQLPADVQHDLDVTLITPGFTLRFWEQLTKRDYMTLKDRLSYLGNTLHAEAVDNWNSITPEDAVALARLCPAATWLPIPCNLQIVADVKSGMTHAEISEKYGVSMKTVHNKLANPFGTRLPDWFRALIPAV